MASISPVILVALCGLLGIVVGTLINLWGLALVAAGSESQDPTLEEDSAGAPQFPSYQRFRDATAQPSPWWHFVPVLGYWLARGRGVFRGYPVGKSGLIAEVGTATLFAGFATAYLLFECQQVPEVRPDEFWKYGRLIYHLVLVGFLAAATSTDLRDYVIPDAITIPGMIIGLLAAGISGQLQMIHIWVDWNQEIPGMRGPYFPDWLDAHRHLHGFAWSIAGAAAGAGITGVTRFMARKILHREAMGFGDVTLMAMIGSYLGWQPMVFVFFLAPLCALLSAPVSYALTGRTFLAYGPYLSLSAFGVMCSWKWLWKPTRLIFGDAQLLAILGFITLGLFAILLGGMRLYESRKHRKQAS